MWRFHLLGLLLLLLTGGCSGDDEAGATDPPIAGVSCTSASDPYQRPTQHQLRRLDLAHASLCRWQTHATARQHEYTYDRMAALPLASRDARRVLQRLTSAAQEEPGCSMMDTPPPTFFTVALEDTNGSLWQVEVPTERCLGFRLANPDTQVDLPFVDPRLPGLLDALAG